VPFRSGRGLVGADLSAPPAHPGFDTVHIRGSINPHLLSTCCLGRTLCVRRDAVLVGLCLVDAQSDLVAAFGGGDLRPGSCVRDLLLESVKLRREVHDLAPRPQSVTRQR
jgi:hypothetical protein